MSKVYEALENAERERVAGLKKKPPLALGPKEEKKTPLVLGPKEEKKTPLVLGPKEEKKTPLALEPREEKKPPLVLGPKEERMERPKTVRQPIRPDRMGSDHPLVSLLEPGPRGRTVSETENPRSQTERLGPSENDYGHQRHRW